MKSAKKIFIAGLLGVFTPFFSYGSSSSTRSESESPSFSLPENGNHFSAGENGISYTGEKGSWLTLEVGGTELYSSYLSPLVYRGWSVATQGVWRRPMRFDRRWEMEFRGKLELGRGGSPAGNSGMWETQGRFSWGMERIWETGRWRLGIGGSVGVTGGVLYLSRNSNNPAAAIAEGNISLTGRAEYRLSLCGRPLILFERVAIPSASILFSPEYGETYYEIWLGNRRGLVNAGWWGNNFGIDNLLGAEWKLGERWLVVGWRSELESSWVHSINTRLWRNAAVIGIRF